MRKIFIFIFSFFLFQTSYAEILKFDCNYYSSWKKQDLKNNLRIIDTSKNSFSIVLTGHNDKTENYELPITQYIGTPTRQSGTVHITIKEKEGVFLTFSWENIGEDHSKGDEYTGMYEKRVSSCFLKHIPVDINKYRNLFSPYVINNCKNFNEDGVELFHDCLSRFQQVELNRINRSKDRCDAMRKKIENSKNYSAGSDVANFLMGMVNGYMENEACG